MARMRSIKPEMFRSFTVSGWPVPVRWTFAGLLTYLDDSGRGSDDPRLIKAEVYPIDDDMTSRKVEQHLAAIEKTGPLCRYQVDGRRYIHITSWAEHQRINRPTKSRIPPCPIHGGGGSGALAEPDSGADEDRYGRVHDESALSEPSSDARPDGADQRVSPHGGLTEPSVNAEQYLEGVWLPAHTQESSLSPHGGFSEGSLPRAQASAPAEHGAREQGSKGTGDSATRGEVAPSAQTLIGEWVDHCPHRPPGKVIGQVAKLLAEMLGEGIPYPTARAGLAAWHQAGKHPATLPSFVHAAMPRPVAAGRSTTDDRVAAALALSEQLATERRGELRALPGGAA